MKRGSPVRLLFPALRWSAESGYAHEEARIETALRRGVGGFCIFGGSSEAVSELTYRTQSRCDYALLFGADLERGAGQQFEGAMALPPLGALGQLDDVAALRRSGELTAREAVALGINWLFAPVADLDLEAKNPIVGTRALGSDPERAALQLRAWLEGAQAAGGVCCAKHFPGHGRTTADSHATLPWVAATRGELERDLVPFRAAIEAGVASIMTAHVAYPALDASGSVATLSPALLQQLLRGELGFEGVIVSDAIIMQGLLAAVDGDEAAGAVAALRAGCDAVLYPDDLVKVADALEAALGNALPRTRVEQSRERIERLAGHSPSWNFHPSPQDQAWAQELAVRTITLLSGRAACPPGLELLTIDDDLGSPWPAPSREPFRLALHEHGITVEPVRSASGAHPLLIALYSDVRAWKQPGLSEAAIAEARRALAARGDALIVLFGHPRLAESLPAGSVLAAWGGEPIMQRAAAAWLGRHAERTVL